MVTRSRKSGPGQDNQQARAPSIERKKLLRKLSRLSANGAPKSSFPLIGLKKAAFAAATSRASAMTVPTSQNWVHGQRPARDGSVLLRERAAKGRTAFVCPLDDPEAMGGLVTLPDGSSVHGCPAFRDSYGMANSAGLLALSGNMGQRLCLKRIHSPSRARSQLATRACQLV